MPFCVLVRDFLQKLCVLCCDGYVARGCCCTKDLVCWYNWIQPLSEKYEVVKRCQCIECWMALCG